MALKKCEQCEEMVDEAKAFCPACGSAFVEEKKRADESNFEAMGSTVQMGQTMYNQMLSDMGLNISKAPSKPEPVVEIQPVAEAAKPTPRQEKISPLIKWLIVVLAALLLLALLVIVVALLIFGYLYRFQ